MQVYGGIEGGGTKFNCAVAISPTETPIDSLKIDTTTPAETLGKVISFFKKYDLKALGFASFGPIDLDRQSPTYGYITATPKVGWKNTPIVPVLRQEFAVPIGWDTDCNVAALGEVCYGAAQGLSSAFYITVGTGVGGGAVIDGQMIHGLVHSEMGHLPLPRHPRDTYAGHCPYHRDCLEGMACGPAIQERWGKPAGELPPSHEAWEFEAFYLAQAICSVTYVISPQRIIVGGGVMHQEQLFPHIRQMVVEKLNGYIQSSAILDQVETYIVPPGLGDRSGTVGALELARRAERGQ